MKINYPLVLDGGLSTVLEKNGCDLNHNLWSANLLDKQPEAIIQAHLEYLEAGAQCITTASYQAPILGFKAAGYTEEQAEELILKSVELAEIAIDRWMNLKNDQPKPLIAASIGPYGAYLANGSEYRGDYVLSSEALSHFHRSRIKLLNNTNADFLACETIPSFQETTVLANILKEGKKSAWISFSCKNEAHINDGTSIQACAKLLSNHPTIFALGVNCTKPEYVSSLIKSVKKEAPNKKIIAYPNSGETYQVANKTWQENPSQSSFLELAKEWMELGADIIGGCCRVGPEQIKELQSLVLRRK